MNVIDPQQLHQHAVIRQREVAAGIAAERRRQPGRFERDGHLFRRALGRPRRRHLVLVNAVDTDDRTEICWPVTGRAS